MDYNVISQSYVLPVVLFVLVLGFTLGLSIGHIQKIYMMPLVETIKPIKRTFDLVKIRVIRMATFGISA